METLIINGESYRVGFSALGRSYRKEYKYNVTTENGVSHSELRGIYLDFVLSLGNIAPGEYDRLMSSLLASPGTVTVTLPKGHTGTETYTGEFDGIGDEVLAQNDGGTIWDNLTLKFTGTVPIGADGL